MRCFLSFPRNKIRASESKNTLWGDEKYVPSSHRMTRGEQNVEVSVSKCEVQTENYSSETRPITMAERSLRQFEIFEVVGSKISYKMSVCLPSFCACVVMGRSRRQADYRTRSSTSFMQQSKFQKILLIGKGNMN